MIAAARYNRAHPPNLFRPRNARISTPPAVNSATMRAFVH
jgi:hypothetical protein